MSSCVGRPSGLPMEMPIRKQGNVRMTIWGLHSIPAVPAVKRPEGSFLALAAMALMAGAVLLGGCNDHRIWPGRSPTVNSSVTVQQLARRLGMRIVESSRVSVTMRDAANTVVIFPDPCGQAYVNGVPVGQTGGFLAAGELLYVPDDVESQIRAAMRASPLLPPSLTRPPGRPLDPNEQPRPIGLSLGRVVIDPGHGGHDTGTNALRGAPEKDINLAIAQGVAQRLRQNGVEPVLTRNSDVFIDLGDRVAIANRSGAKLFVSVHADSSDDRSNQGHTVLVPRSPSAESLAAARAISQSLVAAGVRCHAVRRDDRGLRVLTYTTIPAVLVETGFLSNPVEAARLADSAYQDRVAEAISQGIVQYLRKE